MHLIRDQSRRFAGAQDDNTAGVHGWGDSALIARSRDFR